MATRGRAGQDRHASHQKTEDEGDAHRGHDRRAPGAPPFRRFGSDLGPHSQLFRYSLPHRRGSSGSAEVSELFEPLFELTHRGLPLRAARATDEALWRPERAPRPPNSRARRPHRRNRGPRRPPDTGPHGPPASQPPQTGATTGTAARTAAPHQAPVGRPHPADPSTGLEPTDTAERVLVTAACAKRRPFSWSALLTIDYRSRHVPEREHQRDSKGSANRGRKQSGRAAGRKARRRRLPAIKRAQVPIRRGRPGSPRRGK